MSRKNIAFIWPHEPWKPTSLFKHIVYLGETAGYINKYANVVIFDLSVTKMLKKEILDELKKVDYVFIPIEAYTVRAAVKLSHLAKMVGVKKVVVYGTVAAMNPRLFASIFDIVISTGHWYSALRQLVLDESVFMQRTVNGIYSYAEPMEDKWAYPLLEKLPMQEYHTIMDGQLDLGVQIGCAFNCSFCAEKSLIPENKIYHRSPKDIFQFILDNKSEIYYLDATTFTYDKEWAYEVCGYLKKLPNLPKWRTVTRIDMINEDIIREMKAAGCYKIGFGIETLSKPLQQFINKSFVEKKLIENLKMVKQIGIIPRCFLILGLPGQTADDVRFTNEIVKKLGVEYRWKEYVPFEIISTFSSIEQFDIFERNSYFMHKIDGLQQEEYINLLSISR